jgi:hypothetical protein
MEKFGSEQWVAGRVVSGEPNGMNGTQPLASKEECPDLASAGFQRRRINWIETYDELGASLIVGIGDGQPVKGSAGRAFR